MIVYRLMGLVLYGPFQSPPVPAWFHRRVMQQILATAPRPPTLYESWIAALLLSPVLLVLHWLVGGSIGFFTLPFLFPAGWLLLRLMAETTKGLSLWRSGRKLYEDFAADTRAHLTGHERLCYEQQSRKACMPATKTA